MSPRISVILPTFNRAPWLRRAIDSVLAQTERDFELIVVDDGSTDATAEILESYGARIRVLRQPRGGAYVARNLALRASDSELVAFIDSDDLWYPNRLAAQLPLLQRPEVGLVFGNATIKGSRGGAFAITPPKRGKVMRHFLWGNFICTSTVLVRRSVLGTFVEDVQRSADYLAFFRVAQRCELEYVDEYLVEYTVHSGGISQDLLMSLEDRVTLFYAELSRTSDPSVRKFLHRLLFHLSLHLGVAALRRRRDHLRRAWILARSMATIATPFWLFAFAVHHAIVRGRRVLT